MFMVKKNLNFSVSMVFECAVLNLHYCLHFTTKFYVYENDIKVNSQPEIKFIYECLKYIHCVFFYSSYTFWKWRKR